ncbi:hypothetical protein IWW55_001736 [Coemansia sp. RSA 2706]|nr:hypothetical protein IWW55_001736 [Coemansia sp. RSA 2706]KAJ2322191.1 hypothetical protein IWW52_000246 [Coemansia sp. RSA 2704]KAJ2327768.1 hypothetical protein IWW51_001565 [Coemansia sp. RSA 2702]KAJ2717735.1 hypothetical protein H4R23_005219 [Coemansia sp. Cherry 401B]
MYTDSYFTPMLNSNLSTSSSLCSDYPPSPTHFDYPSFSSSGIAFNGSRRPSRVNLEGSWLDLESDDEDTIYRAPLRMRRKNSDSSSKESRRAISNLRELKNRGTLRIRKLTDKITR